MDELKTENRHMKIQLAALRDQLDVTEQYSRRNCLIFHGVPEEEGESTNKKVMDIVRNKMAVSFEKAGIKGIDRSHRLEKWNVTRLPKAATAHKKGPRPIIVKFKGSLNV